MESYKLEIPRNQFDRIGSAFELEDHYVNGYDIDKDTIIFTVSEQQRKRFAKHAKKNVNHLYWICQMFLPKNIKKYLVK
jgi:hypothetical protein